MTLGETVKCIKEIYQAKTSNSTCICPIACHEIRTFTRISHQDAYLFQITFSYNPLEVVHAREIPEYPLEQFIADFGGLAGLVAGMSIISLLEIIICLTTAIIAKCSG